MVIESYRNRSFRELINRANIVAPDGRPLSIFLRLFEGVKQDRVCGMDIMADILKEAEKSQKSVYFYGTTEELLKVIIKKTKIEFPTLNIAGYHSPPFKALSMNEDKIITEKIRGTHPDLVFVSLGCPKQERWMAEHKTKLNACLLGLGQAFKVYAGQERRLPKWMRNLSLEWAYRLYLEPGRLWKRYAYTNFYFLFLVARYMASRFVQNINQRFSKPFRAT
ncbi:hypothetical protein WSM22_41270 [Cytophagales bacterium WSM2-2]|nr:hypothetical protein WSM22_41270 [Cytophagales bacterium WSM2-2]